MKKVLITDGVHDLLIKGFEKEGFQVDYNPNISLSEVKSIIGEYQGAIINSKIIVDREMLDKATKLKFIGRLGSGMEIIDQPYAKEKGVAVFSAPEGNRNAVAEHALGMLLSLANNLNQGDREVRDFHWDREKNRGFEIMGKTIGIIGFGHTGSCFAKKLSGMGMRILAYDKYKYDYTYPFDYVEKTDLKTIQKESDIISFHLPLTNETKHFVNKNFISQCKKGVVLINTSRGNVIKTEDLILSLEDGSIGGAGLDVFENEKPHTFTVEEKQQYSKLYQFDNVVLSPHVAGWTLESKQKLAKTLLTKILTNFD